MSFPPPARQVTNFYAINTCIFAAMAGGMGWGIRGQYGHETGAMVAGLLVSLILLVRLFPGRELTLNLRAAAWCTVGMGIGGSMTYGQTIGLTQNAHLIGNQDAWWWGMLGLGVKGAVWVGFAGFFFGLGLTTVRYRFSELAWMLLSMCGLFVLGVWLLNEPYEPLENRLPWIYFSESEYWKPEGEVKPRREVWGGLWLSLSLLAVYVRLVRKDKLTFRMALWGAVGGVGFPVGQLFQSYHAWYGVAPWFEDWAKTVNWWNLMETTFGFVLGAFLAIGLWLNRHLVGNQVSPSRPSGTWAMGWEWVAIGLHIFLLACSDFLLVPALSRIYMYGVVIVCIPVLASLRGTWFPWLILSPITLFPIAGKTLINLAFKEEGGIAPALGLLCYFVFPLAVSTFLVGMLRHRAHRGQQANPLVELLLFNTWALWLLNYAVFEYPLPWQTWTVRTPSAIVFFVFAACLTIAALGASNRIELPVKRATPN